MRRQYAEIGSAGRVEEHPPLRSSEGQHLGRDLRDHSVGDGQPNDLGRRDRLATPDQPHSDTFASKHRRRRAPQAPRPDDHEIQETSTRESTLEALFNVRHRGWLSSRE
jgi:hypothetical protein